MRLLRILCTAAALAAATAMPAWAGPAPASPPDTSVLDTAREKVAAGDFQGGITYLAPYVHDHPGDVAAGKLLGDLYFRIPDYKRAENVWRALVALHPDDRELHNRLGSLYAVQDRINEALVEFQKSVPSRDGYEGLVAMHRKAGDLPEFLAKLSEAARSNPLDANAWGALGAVERSMHETLEAKAAFTRQVALAPASCEARLNLANVQVDLGYVDPAIGNLRACLSVNSTYYPAIVNLGEAFLEKNDDKTARPYFDRALEIKANGYEALVDIGYIVDRLGDWRSAVSYYNRALEADPLRSEAYINLGYDFNEHQLFPLAQAAFVKGLSIAPDNGRLHYMLGVTYSLQGKIDLARAQFTDAMSSDEAIVVKAAKSELSLLPGGVQKN